MVYILFDTFVLNNTQTSKFSIFYKHFVLNKFVLIHSPVNLILSRVQQCLQRWANRWSPGLILFLRSTPFFCGTSLKMGKLLPAGVRRVVLYCCLIWGETHDSSLTQFYFFTHKYRYVHDSVWLVRFVNSVTVILIFLNVF